MGYKIKEAQDKKNMTQAGFLSEAGESWYNLCP